MLMLDRVGSGLELGEKESRCNEGGKKRSKGKEGSKVAEWEGRESAEPECVRPGT
jgi:hypothetical protein